MSNPVQPIIVVKKKGGHAGHHGGAWKVAYADFVTAMMAFFLVMWLVNQSKATKAGIGGYFRDPVGFAEGGRGVLPGADSTRAAEAAGTGREQRRGRTGASRDGGRCTSRKASIRFQPSRRCANRSSSR